MDFDGVGKLIYQFPDLNDAHAAGVLKKRVLFKRLKASVKSQKVIVNSVTVFNDFFKNTSVTRLDRAAPPHGKWRR